MLKTPLFALIATLGLAGSAQAMPRFTEGSQVRLLEDTERGSAYAPTPPPSSPDTPRLIAHLGVTFAAGFATVPVGLWLASLIGNLSNLLVAAAIPALLIMGLFAPTLTVAAAYLFGNQNFFGRDDKPFGFLVPWLATVGLNIVALVIAGFAGVSVGSPAGLFLFAAIEGLAMSGTSVGLMRLLQRKETTLPKVTSFVPGVSDTNLLPLATASF